MDVLQPQLIWLEGRCYRKNHESKNDYNIRTKKLAAIHRAEEEEDDQWDDGDCSAVQNERDMEELPGGRFRASLNIPDAFYGKIIGYKGNSKKRVEFETKTRIHVPNRDGTIITVEGQDRSSVSSACLRLELIVSSARKKMSMTHFLCLPMNQPDMRNSLIQFKDEVMRTCSQCRGVEPAIFQKPEKLHLTIGTLVLLNDRERNLATSILKDAQDQIHERLGRQTLRLKVEGLEYMNDDPSEVDVLYAKVFCEDQSDRLQDLADFVVELFRDSGLMTEQIDKVKIHLTVMNTIFRQKNNLEDAETRPGPQRMSHRESFDARKILENFGGHFFGCVDVTSIDLSQLHSQSKDGFYAATIRLSLP